MAIGDLYKKIAGIWVLQGNVRGQQGIQGIPGTNGSVGRTPVLYSAAGAPSGLQLDGDLYLNTTNDDLYSQVSGAWVLQGNLRGATGADSVVPGPTGHTPALYSAAGAPSGLHTDGDLYLNTTNGDLYSQIAGAWVLAGNIKGAAGTNGTNGTNGLPGFDSTQTVVFDDFTRGFTLSTGSGFAVNGAYAPIVYSNTTNTGNLISDNTEPGYALVLIGSGSGTSQQVALTPALWRAGFGALRFRARIRLAALSSGTYRYACTVGLTDVVANPGTTGSNRIMAFYEDDVNSGKWRLKTMSGGSNTDTDTGTVGPSANTWTVVELTVNAAGTSVSMLIDGVSVATTASNIPTGTSLGFTAGFARNTGATSATMHVGWMEAVWMIAR